jgi:hypothetical protein
VGLLVNTRTLLAPDFSLSVSGNNMISDLRRGLPSNEEVIDGDSESTKDC